MARRGCAVGQWLPAARAGCRQAVGELLTAFQNYLLLIAGQGINADLRSKADGSDLVQETFIDAWRDLDQFHGSSEAELKAWLRRLLLHNLANFTRRYRTTAKRQLAAEVGPAIGSSWARWLRLLPVNNSSPLHRSIAQEQADTLQSAVHLLPAAYRQVIRMRCEEGLRFEEIGRLMSRSANAAEKLWLRAISRLQNKLTKP